MTLPPMPARWLPALLLAALLPALAGCTTAPPVAPSPSFATAPVDGLIKRRLTFTPDAAPRDARTLIGVIRLESSGLRAVLLTPQGQRLVTLIHDASGSRFEAGDLPPEAQRKALPIAPAWLASRLEWSLWPLPALREAFAGSAWSVAVIDDAREIRHRGETITRITPADSEAAQARPVLLDDRQGRYLLRITPLEDSAP